jgi:hypothetical protein
MDLVAIVVGGHREAIFEKQYSKRAIPQLTGINIRREVVGNLSCPYQANVINTSETVSSKMGMSSGQFIATPVDLCRATLRAL